MAEPPIDLFDAKVELHDSKQLELKLEYQPSGTDPRSEYFVEAYFFLPKSLNISLETWGRDAFYADLHNYVRLKTPVMDFAELLSSRSSPLLQLEARVTSGLLGPVSEVVYDAKMLACVLRGTLRAFAKKVRRKSEKLATEPTAELAKLEKCVKTAIDGSQAVMRRFRECVGQLQAKEDLGEKASAALRLVDEYVSLLVERYLRRAVVAMESLPREEPISSLRRELMAVVIADEAYRRGKNLPSVLVPKSDNEAYSHRVGFLKKFCMNILFLRVHRTATRKGWEEVLFALAAGGSMAFALAVGLFAQSRYPQASFNFFVLAVVGYMFKDRLKEGLRRLFARYAGRWLYERTTRIVDPVTREAVGVCREKVDYDDAVRVPEEVAAMRATDDLVIAAQGELAETVIRYRKKIALDSEMLPKLGDGLATGVTDIIRINVERLLRDMDDPEYALDYVDLDDFSVASLPMAKSYRVDVVFRFLIDDGQHREVESRMVRLVMNRTGIKRLDRLDRTEARPAPKPGAARSLLMLAR